MKKTSDSQKMDEHLHINITRDMHALLHKAAESKGLNFSSLVRLWLSDRLKEEKIK